QLFRLARKGSGEPPPLDGDGRAARQAQGKNDQRPFGHGRDRRRQQNQVESALLLDIVISKRAPVFQQHSSEDQALLERRDAFLVLNLRLQGVDRIARLYLKGNGLAGQGLDEDLHRTSRLGEAHAQDERNQKGEYSWQVTPPPTLPEMRRNGALLSQLIARVTPAPVRA